MTKAFLILAYGTVFEGRSIGSQGKSLGEVVFTTGMTGYVETQTDPSYFVQIVTQTFPLIGNYGVMHKDLKVKNPGCAATLYENYVTSRVTFVVKMDLMNF